jgi:fucose 4-O-acetylase-like acetyltransferase
MDISTSRISYFDNAKYVLILLVVLGHALEPFKNEYYYITVYTFIYSFHNFMFCLISGYLTKTNRSSTAFNKNISNLLIPFLVFQIIYTLPVEILRGASFDALLIPFWQLWFILSLFYWRASTPYFTRLKHPVIVSLGIAVAFGCCELSVFYLGIECTFTCMPFFLIGYFLPRNFYFRITSLRYRITGLVILVMGAILFHYYIEVFDYRWFYGITKYENLGYSVFMGSLFKVLICGLSVVLGFSFLSLIPKNTIRMSRLGKNSFYVYIWHVLIVSILYNLGVLHYAVDRAQMFVSFAIFFSLALAITMLLSMNSIASFTEYFINGFRMMSTVFTASMRRDKSGIVSK